MSDPTPAAGSWSGVAAVALSLSCAGCYFVPRLLVRLDLATSPAQGTLGSGLAHAAPFVLGAWLAVLGSIGCGVLAVGVAGLALRAGARTAARVSLLVVLGVLVIAMKELKDDHARLPTPAPTPKLDPRCVEDALAGRLARPECLSKPAAGPLKAFKP